MINHIKFFLTDVMIFVGSFALSFGWIRENSKISNQLFVITSFTSFAIHSRFFIIPILISLSVSIFIIGFKKSPLSLGDLLDQPSMAMGFTCIIMLLLNSFGVIFEIIKYKIFGGISYYSSLDFFIYGMTASLAKTTPMSIIVISIFLMIGGHWKEEKRELAWVNFYEKSLICIWFCAYITYR